jgi:hypothetical protein
MGGRISGESPREKKDAARKCTALTIGSRKTKVTGDAVTATTATQVSKQQFVVWTPLGQQELAATP